jgi:hypothetical protein
MLIGGLLVSVARKVKERLATSFVAGVPLNTPAELNVSQLGSELPLLIEKV